MCVCVLVSLLYSSWYFILHGGHETAIRVCVCWSLVSLISISIVLVKKKKKRGRRASPPPPPPPSPPPLLTPRAVAVCLFSPVIGSLLSAHETDGVRLMGVFVAPFASGGSGWESGAAVRGGRKTHSRYPPEGGERERERQAATYSSNCQANFTHSFEMSPKMK